MASFDKVLVTGGAGFIGSHLVEALFEEEKDVTVLDNFSTGKLQNLQPNLSHMKIRVIQGDVRAKQEAKDAIGDSEVVFHLAAVTSVPYSVAHPDAARKVNVAGTLNLLDATLDSAVDHFIFVSSCAVYGEAQHLPIDEEEPTNPLSPYAESKLEAERLCQEYQRMHGLKTTILRPFNVYGPRMRSDQYGGVMAKFIERLGSSKPPVIYGDGKQTRDFIHVHDVVSAMKIMSGNDKAFDQAFNIGTGIPTTIDHLARLLARLIGREEVPEYRPAKQGDLMHSYASVQKAKSCLKFEPQIHLKDGLLSLLTEKMPANRSL